MKWRESLTFVTSADERSRILVAIVTGGRPLLAQRTVRKFLGPLVAAGVADIRWIVNDRHVSEYEPDEYPFEVYPDDWAFEYARDHWMSPDQPPTPGGFFGAFPGREWANRTAEREGYWACLQLDDNIDTLQFVRGGAAANATATEIGALGCFTDLLAGVALSTNARLVGAHLDAVPAVDFRLARTGFPYSLFIERVGEGREEWFGPFEDDITHALQYGDRADGATAAIVPLIRYQKEQTSRSGMRASYHLGRSRQLQRLNPQFAKVGVRRARANGKGTPRIYHSMPGQAIRNPLRVTDAERYARVQATMVDYLRLWRENEKRVNREKILRRTQRGAGDG
jgi:hypothetical protein